LYVPYTDPAYYFDHGCAQGRSESEVNHLLFGREGTSITIEVMSPSGDRRHATMVRVRADIGDPAVALIEEKTWEALCCKI
jgi:hypothetical protein